MRAKPLALLVLLALAFGLSAGSYACVRASAAAAGFTVSAGTTGCPGMAMAMAQAGKGACKHGCGSHGKRGSQGESSACEQTCHPAAVAAVVAAFFSAEPVAQLPAPAHVRSVLPPVRPIDHVPLA
jgi:hypothetical protein